MDLISFCVGVVLGVAISIIQTIWERRERDHD